MKTTKDYLDELELLVEIEITTYSKKIDSNSNQEHFDKILKDFNTSIASIGTGTAHKIILEGIVDNGVAIAIANRLKVATERFIKLNSR